MFFIHELCFMGHFDKIFSFLGVQDALHKAILWKIYALIKTRFKVYLFLCYLFHLYSFKILVH